MLDINVLLALAWPNHQFHGAAAHWFKASGMKDWATCAVTELGFVRLSCNPAFTPHPRTPSEAVGMLVELRKVGQHRYVADLPAVAAHLPASKVVGHKQITDAYLVGAAMHTSVRVATFDQRMTVLAPDHVTVLDAIVPL